MSPLFKATARTTCAVAIATVMVAVGNVAVSSALPIPNKFLLSGHIGWKVDKASGGNTCAIASKEECQQGEESSEAGGFAYPESLATASDGSLYVADGALNHRIQEFGGNGEFVLMFGWDVNKTKVEQVGSTQQEKNVCTAASHDVCQAGEAGTGLAGQLGAAQDIAVDGKSDDVYVFDPEYRRVDEYTATGEFVLTIGGEVNETKDQVGGATEAEENLCTAASHDVCKTGVESVEDSTAHGAFKPAGGAGSLLAVDSAGTLYVGDEQRVQEFESTGAWKRELSLTSIYPEAGSRVGALAVDGAGDLYVVYAASSSGEGVNVVRELNPSGVQLEQFKVHPAEPSTSVAGMALDPQGRLGLIVRDGTPPFTHGFLYSVAGERISEFAPEFPSSGFPQALAFTGSDELYVNGIGTHEVESYAPVVFAEVRTCPVEDVTATSADFCGEINPNGVPTAGLFDYYPPAGTQSSLAFEGDGTAFTPVHDSITGLEPNETYHYKAHAEGSVEGEALHEDGEEVEFHTPTLPPEIVGEPSVSFVKAQSAVLTAVVNPEHSSSGYRFEYGACPTLVGCATVLETPEESSSQYGAIGVGQEIVGLEPLTTYSYRFVVEGEAGKAIGTEGTFTTGSRATVHATTGAASGVTDTTAVIYGSVDPEGQAATYTFEVGLYAGAGTQFGTVFSAGTGAVETSVEESFGLSGLQPGVTYAYRIAVHSGYGVATGATQTFTTQGLSSVISPPPAVALIPVPNLAFPKPVTSVKGKAKKPTPKKRKKIKTKSRKGKKKARGARP
jgi:hypothetical protein